ncbi:MAG: CPBP family glutamic-type intramembrane protease [Chloroflexi bacterium]|nr:CPBP family glutamic-type intramembrane protease [Chloroflexota bacterium]
MNKTIRNITLMGLVTIGGGWLGIWLNNVTGNTAPPMQSLGALIWLVSPALAGILLRAFGGDGWQDAGFGLHLRSGWVWYLVAILVYPLVALLTFRLAAVTGAISAEGFAAQGFGAYLSAAGVMMAGSLVKNIFEEFAWRSYLTPRLDAAKVPRFLNHLIVGILWWSWHLSYYAYYLDKATLKSFMTTSLPVFLALGLVSLIPTAILFGELQLASKSTWPAFILHNIINGLSMPLIINGFITLNPPLGTILTPTNEGILTSFLLGAAGVVIYRNRMGKTQNK